MKSSTQVWVAIRNIGDSQDEGESHFGTLSESILWLAQKLAAVSMAGRIVMGMGRTQAAALLGVDVKGAGKTALNADLRSMLGSIFDDESSEPEQDVGDNLPIDGDSYVPR